MPPAESALLAAVAADPGSDLPRLVYADWLDDHGHPVRAAHIRAECELARRGYDGGPYPDDLQDALSAGPDRFHPWGDPGTWYAHTHRGFLHRVGFHTDRILAAPQVVADFLRACTPAPEWVEVAGAGRSGSLAKLANWPGLAHVTALSLVGLPSGRDPRPPAKDFAALAASPHLGRLCQLDVSTSRLSAATLGTLLAGRFPALERLHVGLNPLGDAGVQVLAGWPGLARLRWLDLSWIGLTAAGARAVADSPFAPAALEVLSVNDDGRAAAARAVLADRFGAALLPADADIPF